jgi:hypothetical protein
MSMEFKENTGLDYLSFQDRLKEQGFTRVQEGALQLRLSSLESFLADTAQPRDAAASLNNTFNSVQGTLTIVDLSCPFVNQNDACALFSICLGIFMESRGQFGRLLAMDEAHKVSDHPCPAMRPARIASYVPVSVCKALIDWLRCRGHLRECGHLRALVPHQVRGG